MRANRPNPLEKLEKAVVRDFAEYDQNTHKLELSNSVGMALLKLGKAYLGDAPTEEAANKFMTQCCDELALLLSDPAYETFHSAIRVMLNKAAHELDPNGLDRVTLFLPTQNDAYEEVCHVFPIKEVLALVWHAMRDHKRYTHHYEGTPAQKLAQAQEDYNERLNSFLKRLKALEDKPVCRHGVRNELVFLLNGTYKGIHLLEDMKATIFLYLKDKLIERLSACLTNLDEKSQERKLLVAALITWMSESNARQLSELLDPKKEIVEELKSLCRDNGCNPKAFKLDEKIDEALTGLAFHCDPKTHLAFAQGCEILNEIEMSSQTVRNNALSAMQTWLRSECQFNDNDIRAIKHFHAAMLAHKNLCCNRNLLMISGRIEEKEIDQFILKFIAHFEQSLTNPGLTSVCETDLDAITFVGGQIVAAKREELVDFVENFFVRWFSNSESERKTLYSSLLDENIIKKIVLTDENIKKFQLTAAVDGVLDIPPYMINRIFLHAILVSLGKWTDAFAELFEKTRRFVEAKFNMDASHDVVSDLMRDSYHGSLLRQLRYLQGKKEGKSDQDNPRPERMILLPADARTFVDWRIVLDLIAHDKDKKNNICQANSVLILAAVIQAETSYLYSFSDLIRTISWLENEAPTVKWRAIFVCKYLASHLPKVEKPDDLRFLLAGIPKERYQETVNLLGDKIKKITYYRNHDGFIFGTGIIFGVGIPDSNVIDWIKALRQHVKYIFPTSRDLAFLREYFPLDIYLAVLEGLGDQLQSIISNHEDLLRCLDESTYFSHYRVAEAMPDKIFALLKALGQRSITLMRMMKCDENDKSNTLWSVFEGMMVRHEKSSVEFETWIEVGLQFKFGYVLALKNSDSSLYVERRKEALAWVLSEASRLAFDAHYRNIERAYLLLNSAYHHPIFAQSKNPAKAFMISSVNSVATLFGKREGEGEGKARFIESGFQEKLRQLKEKIDKDQLLKMAPEIVEEKAEKGLNVTTT